MTNQYLVIYRFGCEDEFTQHQFSLPDGVDPEKLLHDDWMRFAEADRINFEGEDYIRDTIDEFGSVEAFIDHMLDEPYDFIIACEAPARYYQCGDA